MLALIVLKLPASGVRIRDTLVVSHKAVIIAPASSFHAMRTTSINGSRSRVTVDSIELCKRVTQDWNKTFCYECFPINMLSVFCSQ